MYIGIIILVVASLLCVLGVLNSMLFEIGAGSIFALLTIGVFAVGVALPPIVVTDNLTLSIAGIAAPIFLLGFMFYIVSKKIELFECLVKGIMLTAVYIGLRLAFINTGEYMLVGVLMIVGFTIGVTSFIVCRDTAKIMFSVLFACVVGNVAYVVVGYSVGGLGSMNFGENNFDILALGLAVSITMLAVVNAVKNMLRNSATNSTALNQEAGQDVVITTKEQNEFDDYFED